MVFTSHFIRAQVVSQISSHWIIHYQRKVIAAGLEQIKLERQAQYGCFPQKEQKQLQQQQMANKKVEALCDHKFILGGSRVGQKLHIRKITNLIVGLFGCLTIIMIFAGSSVEYLQLEHSGLVYFALNSSEKDYMMNYSIFTTSTALMNLASYMDRPIFYIGFFILSFLMVFTCTVVPILQALMTLWLWYIPMTMDRKRKVMWYIEIAKAWQYTEVFFFGCVIMMWQIGQISEGMMDIACGAFEDVFRDLSGNGVLEEKHARCWHVNASLKTSVSVHIISTMMLNILSHFVEMAYEQSVRDHRVSDDTEEIDTEAENEDIMINLENNNGNSQFFTEILSGVKSAHLQFTDYYTNAVSLIPEEKEASNKSAIISTGIEVNEKKKSLNLSHATDKKMLLESNSYAASSSSSSFDWVNDTDDHTTDLFEPS